MAAHGVSWRWASTKMSGYIGGRTYAHGLSCTEFWDLDSHWIQIQVERVRKIKIDMCDIKLCSQNAKMQKPKLSWLTTNHLTNPPLADFAVFAYFASLLYVTRFLRFPRFLSCFLTFFLAFFLFSPSPLHFSLHSFHCFIRLITSLILAFFAFLSLLSYL